MNVGFIISGLGTGGAEFALLRLCRALLARDVRPNVISLLDGGAVGPLLRQTGVPVLPLELKSPRGWMRARRMSKEFQVRHAPDIVQGWMYHGNLAGLHLAPAGCPVTWGIRQSLRGNQDKCTTRAAIRICALRSAQPAAIVYNSYAAKSQHELRGFSSQRSSVIPNGFDLDAFRFDAADRATLRRTMGLGPQHFVIGHVARFHPSKDHAGFLRAAASVARYDEAVRIVVAGDGVDRSNVVLAGLIAQLGLANRVHLLGPRTDVPALMSSFDLFCSSSSGMEGFPNVVAEAMSCEVVCVATDVGDSHDVVGDTGEVVPPSNSEALAQAMHRFLHMPATKRRALGMKARQRIEDRFAIGAVADQYIRLYESLLRRKEASSCAA